MDYTAFSSIDKSIREDTYPDTQTGSREFRNDLSEAIIKSVEDITLNRFQAELIVDSAWQERHSYGYSAVANTAIDLTDFVVDVIKLG